MKIYIVLLVVLAVVVIILKVAVKISDSNEKERLRKNGAERRKKEIEDIEAAFKAIKRPINGPFNEVQMKIIIALAHIGELSCDELRAICGYGDQLIDRRRFGYELEQAQRLFQCNHDNVKYVENISQGYRLNDHGRDYLMENGLI